MLTPATTPLPETSPEEGARRIAIGYCIEANEAAHRLMAGADPEALHDLRVGLRRLRSLLRFFEDELADSVRKKLQRRIRAIARATGEARDAEVQLAWIEAQLSRHDWTERAGARWWAAALSQRKDGAYQELKDTLVPELVALLPKLERDLAHFREERSLAPDRPRARFGERVARHLRAETSRLAAALASVRTTEDEGIAHEARIHGKRVRYLIEPLKDELEEARDGARALRALQEKLGGLNDLAVRTQSLGSAMEAQALDRARRLAHAATSQGGELDEPLAGEEPGLASLLREAHDAKAKLLGEIIAEYVQGDGLASILSTLERLATALETPPPSGLPLEIERKYLLRATPPILDGRPFAEIDQGYLPGERLHERVRRKKTDAGTIHLRTIKLGAGVSRIEIEETCSAKVFEKLWSLTTGKRVRKHRYAIAEGELTWEIDVFLDRELVLAEIELPSADRVVEIPPWLLPYVVREVTDEPAYLNLSLAK
jgi:CHAD domain-containing protein/CYTH domain-containing protein